MPIIATFQPENKKDELDEYLSTVEKRQYSRHKNNFDKAGRPIFENSVLFIFEGEVNEAKNSIINQCVFAHGKCTKPRKKELRV